MGRTEMGLARGGCAVYVSSWSRVFYNGVGGGGKTGVRWPAVLMALFVEGSGAEGSVRARLVYFIRVLCAFHRPRTSRLAITCMLTRMIFKCIIYSLGILVRNF